MRILSTLQVLATVAAPVRAAFTWSNVRIGGGGGFTPGIVFHPTAKGVAYARTDMGGLYRLNSDDSWTPLTDSITDHTAWNRWGIDALALDPLNSNKLYAAVGMYTNSWDSNNGAIIRSSDKGATWSITTLPFKVGGNMPGRGMGERLAVDPKNSNIIYFGTRSGNGLYRSTDGGASFSKVSSFTAVGNYVVDPNDANGYNSDKQGLAWVTFDPTSAATAGGATSRIFVGTAENATSSVWVSNDAGSTWSAVAGQPGRYFPHKGKLQPGEGALYVTYADGTGPYDGTSGSVWRYDIAAATWRDITPVSGSDLYYGFGGLAVDMLRPGTLVVASLNSWYPDAQIFRSTDSGATWSPLWQWASWPAITAYYGLYTDKAPWINAGFTSQDSKRLGWMIEALEIDPLDSDHWLYGTGLTIFGGHDLTKWDSGTGRNVSIHSLADGIEQMSVQDVASSPAGSELLAAVGDDSGFTFRSASDLSTPPSTPWMTPMWSTATSVDYAGNRPSAVVRVGNAQGSPMAAFSSDGGATWYVHPGAGSSAYGGEVALSADGDAVLWATSNNGVLLSRNSGAFTAVTGLSLSGTVAVAADRRRNGVFYAADASAARVHVSTDGGATFAASAAGGLGTATGVRDVVSHPDRAGVLYVSTDAGVFRSGDSGATFEAMAASLADAHRLGVGRAASGAGWTLYAFGKGAVGYRLYGIDADAASSSSSSWTDIQGAVQGFGAVDACRVAGSGNVAGQVYVGTNGRGVFVGRGSVGGGGGSASATATATTTTSRAGTTTAASSSSSSVATTLRASTTTTATSAPPTATVTAQRYGQCGGNGWTGPTVCVSPWVCTTQNDWYSQCL